MGAGALAIGEVTSFVIKEHSDDNNDISGNEDQYLGNKQRTRSSGKVAIQGVDDLMTSYAQCCRPVPPEKIVGYITQGKGITIHRTNCPNLQDLLDKRPERVFTVSWHDEAEQDSFVIKIIIKAYDRKHLIRDITGLLSEEKIPILEMNSKVDKKEMVANLNLQIEVPNLQLMARILNKLSALPTIYSVERV